MKPATPKSIKAAHEQLHADLVRVSRESGELGNAAKVAIRLLQGHFERAEAHVLPLLSLLPGLAAGGASADLPGAEALAKGVRDEVRQLIQGHGFLAASLEDLVRAAREGDHAEAAEVAYAVMTHLRLEEEVLFPAVLLAVTRLHGPQA